MKLDREPRLTAGQTLFASLVDWARMVVQAINGNDEANTAAIAAAVALVAPPGLFAVFHRTAAPAGWIVADGSTIGNTGSGATRANVDTLPLFTVLWAYSDALVPILTSAGAGSTRGASAAADWAANKRMTVPDARDRFVRIASATNINGTKYAESAGAHVHEVSSSGRYGTAANVATAFATIDTGGTGGAFSLKTAPPDSGGTELRPINIAMLGCFKL